jgi:outer membrane lipoprotein carrier protein
MRLSVALCLLVPLSCAAKAEDLTAAALAARVDQHYNTLRSLRVDFTQQYDGLGQHRRESGTLLIKKPGRMKWSYAQPAGKLFVLDGRDAFFYSPGQSEVQRVPAKKLDDLRSPLRFLLGRTQLAKELNGLKMTPDGDGFHLSGLPKGMEQRVASLTFRVTTTGAIVGIKVEEVDGSLSTFAFSDEAPNPAATDADFVFHAPPGTTIVDGLPPE